MPDTPITSAATTHALVCIGSRRMTFTKVLAVGGQIAMEAQREEWRQRHEWCGLDVLVTAIESGGSDG